MKRGFIGILTVVIAVLLTACNEPASGPQIEVTEINGQTLTITFDEHNLSAGTITAPNGEYTFERTVSQGNTAFKIVYPDGYVYRQTECNLILSFPPEYDATERENNGFIDGLSLTLAIESAMSSNTGTSSSAGASNNGGQPWLAIALLALGAWNTFAPNTTWRLTCGWWYKNAEPSEVALVLYRGLGVLLMAGGLICLLVSL